MTETDTETKPLLPGEFKHNGRVLGLRSLKADFTSYNGFANPRNVGDEVFALDWNASPVCGFGLHFVPWGLGCDGQEGGMHRPVWQVVEPIGEVVTIGGKCKSPGLRVVHVGTLAECTAITVDGLNAFIAANSSGSASSTGSSGSASSTGDSGSASSTGSSGSASSTGYASVAACTGLDCKAMAGAYGVIALATQLELSPGVYRREMHCARIGCGDGSDGLLKANTWYSIDKKGNFVEEKQS